jgi:hypothetical protein
MLSSAASPSSFGLTARDLNLEDMKCALSTSIHTLDAFLGPKVSRVGEYENELEKDFNSEFIQSLAHGKNAHDAALAQIKQWTREFDFRWRDRMPPGSYREYDKLPDMDQAKFKAYIDTTIRSCESLSDFKQMLFSSITSKHDKISSRQRLSVIEELIHFGFQLIDRYKAQQDLQNRMKRLALSNPKQRT